MKSEPLFPAHCEKVMSIELVCKKTGFRFRFPFRHGPAEIKIYFYCLQKKHFVCEEVIKLQTLASLR